jgi:hypothetical protein
MTDNLRQKLKGILIPNAFATTVIGLTKYLVKSGGGGNFTIAEFVIIPILMGLMSAWFWKDLNLKGRLITLYSVYNTFLAILLSFIYLGEGVICLLIVSPLIFSFIVVGALFGKSIFKKNNSTLNVSVITLLLFIFISDSLSKHEYENMVSDTIIINAPPNKVWKNVVSFEKIKQKNSFWLFRIGMPSPMATTVTGYYKGAGRKCIFSNGYVFGEKIATYEPLKDLTFDIIDQPRDPEIMNHIDILRGQFLLKDNGNGTTTLIGNSWYKLYVFPVWYYDIWAQNITRNVHLRVMKHIKELSEN